MDHQPDMRDWSFAKRALAEIQQAKRKKWYSFWVQVELPDGKKHWYQLPRDVQYAMRQHEKKHRQDWFLIIKGALINVPVSAYDEHGNVELMTGVIRRAERRHQHTFDPAQITRSQFVQPRYSWWGISNLKEMIVYLQHDHNQGNREQIKRDVKIINRNWQRARWQAPCRLMLKYSLAVSCLVMLCSWSIVRGLLLVGGLIGLIFSLWLDWYLRPAA